MLGKTLTLVSWPAMIRPLALTAIEFQRTRIDAAEAMRLPNETASIINDPGYYLVTLDVFHQLHCLDFVRKRLYPSRYNTVSDLGLDRNGTRVSEIEHTGKIESMAFLESTSDIFLICFLPQSTVSTPYVSLFNARQTSVRCSTIGMDTWAKSRGTLGRSIDAAISPRSRNGRRHIP